MGNLLAPLALGDCPPKSVPRYVANCLCRLQDFMKERASASQAATYLERAHNSRFVPWNKTAVFHLVDRVLVAKSAALLVFEIERETET
jgi:hypothetical protein